MLSRVSLSKVSLVTFASIILATTSALAGLNTNKEDESILITSPLVVHFNQTKKKEIFIDPVELGTVRSKTTEPLKAAPKKASLSAIEQLPVEILLQIFSYLSLRELSQVSLVSSRLQKVSRTVPLWKEISFKLGLIDESLSRIDLDYKAIVSENFDRTFIYSITNKIYHLMPIDSSTIKKNSLMAFHSLIRLCRLGYEEALLKAANVLLNYKTNEVQEELRNLMETTAKELNDLLIIRGNREAVERKIEGFAFGMNGYEENPAGARELIEALVAQRDRKAIDRKITGLALGICGYEENPAAARELIEDLVAQGDREAIEMKIDGLSNGEYGYKKDPTAARELKNVLVLKGNCKIIQRKIKWPFKNRQAPWKNYIDSLEMALAPKESPWKIYIDRLESCYQRLENHLKAQSNEP